MGDLLDEYDKAVEALRKDPGAAKAIQDLKKASAKFIKKDFPREREPGEEG